MGNDAARLACRNGQAAQHLAQLLVIMAIRFDDSPAEASPLLCEWLETESLWNRPETLNLVVIHDYHEVVEAVMRGEQDCFPVRALVAFTITEQNDDAVFGTVEPGRVRHSGSDRQPMAERPRRQLDSRNAFVGN